MKDVVSKLVISFLINSEITSVVILFIQTFLSVLKLWRKKGLELTGEVFDVNKIENM